MSKRHCKICDKPITDRTRSKRCLECRLPDPRTCQPKVKIIGPRPAPVSTSPATRARSFLFFPGLHQPGDARHFALACISINRLWTRRARVGNRRTSVLVDSGAFTEISKHGRWRNSVAIYAHRLFELHANGVVSIVAAAAQDYMCEAFILRKTGMTVEQHQRLTVERYDALLAELMRLFAVVRAEDLPFPVMPVLQGWSPADYVQHIRMYGDRLRPGMWIGVGSVCKRNSKVASVEDVLSAIKEVRPDLRLHGFRSEDHRAQEPTRAPAAVVGRLDGLVVRRPVRGPQRQRLARGAQVLKGGSTPGQRQRPRTVVAVRRPAGRVRVA